MQGRYWLILAILIVLLVLLRQSHNGEMRLIYAAPAKTVQTPVLKWQQGGCYASWCETGWYSSPAVADLDKDGTVEVIGATYSLFVLNGEDGSEQWRVDPDGDRVWPGVVVNDIDGDGDMEVITAQGSGYVNLFDHTGALVWSQRPATNELRGLSVFDLDDDGTMEIIVTAAVGSKTNTWVLEHDGQTRAGWPQLSNDSGYAWGVYNDNAGVGDLDGDGLGEIVVPSDVHYINAYEANGDQIQANAIYGDKGWGRVGVHVDHEVDLRGYANCGVEHRPNFANSPASLVDVNGDGKLEVIVVGNVYNCGTDPYTDLYHMPFIFKADRSRWSGNGFDWTAIPIPDGSAVPLIQDYNIIESVLPNPVVADLDGDGMMEILYASYDGRVHAYWLDKTEHGNWPYAVYNAGEGFYRFASEPAVADLDDDGLAEVIFTSWVQKGTNQTGKLHILDYLGQVLQEVDLPPAFGGPDWNGAMAAPTLANIDADADLEIVINTAHAGLAAYDLPGTAQARVLWGTGRGSYQRNGAYWQGSLQEMAIHISNRFPEPGEAITYTLILQGSGPTLPNVRLTDTLSTDLYYLGNLWASAGSYGESGRVITWHGAVSASPITLTYGVTVSERLTSPQTIANMTILDDGQGKVSEQPARIIVNSLRVYLPVMIKME